MKSTHLLASLATVSVIGFAFACSSSSDKGSDDGSGGHSSTSSEGDGSAGEGTGGNAGKGTGGNAGSAGKGDGGSAGAATGGVAGQAAGGHGPIDGGTDADMGSGGATSPDGGDASGGSADASHPDGASGNCQANLQTDPENCGRCGKSCAGGDCSDGLCQPVLVLDAQEEPYRPGLDGYSAVVSAGKVYEWEYTTTNAIHNVVESAPTTPTNPASQGTLIQDVPSDPTIDAVTFDATYIYEAIEEAAGVKGEVSRKKLDRSENTGAATKLFSLPADLKWENIAVATDAIYVTGTTQLNGPSHPVPDTTTFYRIALPVANATALPTAIPGIGARTDVITDLTVVGTHLFWLESYGLVDWRLTTAPVTGGTPVELDPDVVDSSSAIASDGTYVYWATINDLGELRRCPLANLDAAHVTKVADVSNAREGLLIQGQYLFTMELVDRAVFRINKTDGTKELLGNMQVPPSFKGSRVIGLDSNFLYMTTQDAKVWRLPNVP